MKDELKNIIRILNFLFVEDVHLKALNELMELGVKIFIDKNNSIQSRSSKTVSIGCKEPLTFDKVPLSVVSIAMPSISGNIYKFYLQEIRMLSKNDLNESCIINLNNTVFIEVLYEYFEHLTILHNGIRDEREIKLSNEQSWTRILTDELKGNSKELFENFISTSKKKTEAENNENYAEAAKLRDMEIEYLEKIKVIADKLFAE